MLQNGTPLRKSAPSPPNSSDEDVSCTAPATENASLQILFKCPTPAIVFGYARKPSRFAPFWQGAQSLAPAKRNHIWTSKSAPYPTFFCTFDFDMCFAPQQRALFRHLNFQMRFDTEVFCTFWLPNVLRATMACTFSTAQLLKVLRGWGVLYILTWKCASRHNGVHFFISHLARLLRTRRFSEPTFRPSRATNLRKNTVSVLRLSYLFAHLDLLSSETFSFASFLRTWIFFLLRLSLSCSLLFSDSSHLCFSSVHIVGSLTCKLLNFLR